MLFFVSVGMLFDPSDTGAANVRWNVLGVVLVIIVVGKSLAAFVIVLAVPLSGRAPH